MDVIPIQNWIRQRVSVRAESSCWIWTKSDGTPIPEAQYSDAYIPAGMRSGLDSHKLPGHRLSYVAFNGPLADGMVVCHKCDVPACVNPDHLFAGTHADNTADAKKKGRLKSGRKPQSLRYIRPTQRIVVLVTPTELEHIRRAATADTRSVSSMCRVLILENLALNPKEAA